jgi:hypothetical protein
MPFLSHLVRLLFLVRIGLNKIPELVLIREKFLFKWTNLTLPIERRIYRNPKMKEKEKNYFICKDHREKLLYQFGCLHINVRH